MSDYTLSAMPRNTSPIILFLLKVYTGLYIILIIANNLLHCIYIVGLNLPAGLSHHIKRKKISLYFKSAFTLNSMEHKTLHICRKLQNRVNRNLFVLLLVHIIQGFMQDHIFASHTCFGGHMDVNSQASLQTLKCV